MPYFHFPVSLSISTAIFQVDLD